MKTQKYCISAEDRRTRKRVDISGPKPKKWCETFEPSDEERLSFCYFKMAKYPYYKVAKELLETQKQ